MLGVDNVIARLQIDQIGGKSGQRGLGNRSARHQFRGLEQVLGTKYYKLRIGKAVPWRISPLTT